MTPNLPCQSIASCNEVIISFFFDILQITESGFIATNNLKTALDHVGLKLPNHQVRELLTNLKTQGKYDEGKGISKDLFKQVSKSM